MSGKPDSKPADDVGRLLKQLDMGGFHFQRFDDADGEAADPGRIEPAAGRVGVEPAVPSPSPTMAMPSLPPAAVAAGMAHVDGNAGALSAAFSRLAGQGQSRHRPLPGFALNLPERPPLAMPAPVEPSLGALFQQLLKAPGGR